MAFVKRYRAGLPPLESEHLRRLLSALRPFLVVAVPWVIWGVFGVTDVWRARYFESGLNVVLDSLARLALLLVLIEACRGIGRVLGLSQGFFDSDLYGIAAGFMISHIIGSLIGLLGWLSPIVACTYLSFGLVLATRTRPAYFDCRSFSQLSVVTGVALTAALAIGMTFILARAIPIDFLSTDFAHYLPYYDHVRSSGYTFPSPNFIATFYLKGAGLNHLVVQLSDPLGSQLVGAFAVLLISGAIGRVAATTTSSQALGFFAAAAVLLAHQYWSVLELEKAHPIVSAIVVLLAVQLVNYDVRGLTRPEMRATLLTAFTGSYIAPVATLFVIPICCLFAMVDLRKRGRIQSGIEPFGAALAGVVTTLAYSYAVSGLFDFSPFKLMFALRNEERLSRWIDPTTLLWFSLYNAQAFEAGISAIGLAKRPDFLASVFALAASVVLMRTKLMKAADSMGMASVAALSFAIVIAVHETFRGQRPDLDRFAAFLPAMAALGTLACVRTVLALTNPEGPTPRLVAVLSLLGLTLLTCAQLAPLDAYRKAVLRGASAVAGLIGPGSSIESAFPAPECTAAALVLPENSRVLVLGLQFACYTRPGTAFLRFEADPMNKEFEALLYGSPETSKEVYLRHGIHYFLFSGKHLGNYLLIPPPQLFASLFAPENIGAHLRIAARLDPESYLLTLDAEGIPIDAEFLEYYRRVREQQMNTTSARAFFAIASMRALPDKR